jgi:thiol-disulfide isomerase/thioredoxin
MVLKQLSVVAIALGLSCNPSSPSKTQSSTADNPVIDPLATSASNDAPGALPGPQWVTDSGSDAKLLLTTLEGKDVSLASLAAKVTVIAVWSSYCEPCKEELPFVEALHKKYQGDKDVAIVTVSLDDDAQTAADAAKAWNLTMPVLLDISKQLQTRFSIKPNKAYLPLPTFIVIDSKFRFVREVGFQTGVSQAEFVTAKSKRIELAKLNQLPDEKLPSWSDDTSARTMKIPAGSQKAWLAIRAKLKTYGFGNAVLAEIGNSVKNNKEVTLELPEPKAAEPTVERNSNGTRKTFPASPSDVPGKMHVFHYADFGPQALAGTNGFGADCYGDCCCSEPGDSFDVRVVVYQGVTQREVKQRFTSDPNRGEYRYMPADEAKKFIADSVKDMAQNAAEDGLENLLTTLRRTSQQLATLFP